MQTFYAVFANPAQAHDVEAALKKAGLPKQNLKIAADTFDLNEEANLSAAASFAWVGDQSAAVAGGMDITGGGGLFAPGGVGAGGGTISGGGEMRRASGQTQAFVCAWEKDRWEARKIFHP